MALIAGQVPMSGYRTPDYTGVAEASALPLKAITGIAGQVGDYFKQQGEKKKLIKKSDVQIDAALKLFPDLTPALQGYRDQLKDENLPLDDRMAIADSVSKVIDLGIGEMRNAQSTLMQQQRLQMEQAYKGAQLGLKERQVAATEFGAMQSAKPTFDLQKATITSPDGETFEMEIPYDKEKGMFFDADVGKYIKDINKWGFGEPSYVEGEAMPTPTSQIAPSGQINQSALSSPLRQYAQSFEEYGNKYGVDPALLAAIAEHETGGGKSSAFRNKNNAMGVSNASGPVKMASVEASIEKMASLLGRGINEGKGPYANAKSIEDIGRRYAPIGAGNDPGNLNKFWTRGVSSKYEKLATPKQIDDAISMGGDMTQQAMGTPQQQAEIARMIEEGQGMAMAQNMPQGTMGTEPSIATQQSQQDQPKLRPRPGFAPVRPQGQAQFRQATPEEVATYGTQGQVNTVTGEFKPIRPPSGMVIEQTKDGGFRVVQGAGAVGRQEQAAQAAKEQGVERATMGTQEIGRALKVLDSGVMQGSGPLASFYRAGAAKFVKGTPEYQLANNFIAPIKSMLAFNELNKMRMASPTGGALGNVAKFETDMLQQSAGQLDIDKTDPKTLRENLMRLQGKYLDVIHGTSEQRRNLLQEGKITKEQYFDIESLYPAFTMSATGETVPRQMEGVTPQDQESEADRILRELGE